MAFWNSKKSPKLQDKSFEELAQMFFALPDDPTPGSEFLDASQLNFSVESLASVDKHLEMMRKKNLAGQSLIKFVLRCGAYVGEVIRRNIKGKEYHWLDYENAAKLDKNIAGFGKNIGTIGILWDGKTGFTFPLNKVIKFLQNGSEDSVRAFAKVIISQPSIV
jgi:hypothetical protein